MTVSHAGRQIVESSPAAAGKDRNFDRIRNRARERKIVSRLGSVAIHRGEKNFSRAETDQLARMLDRIESGRPSPAMREDFVGWMIVRVAALLGIDGRDDALAAEFFRRFAHE